MELIDRDGKDLLVGSLLILHHQRTDRTATHDRSRHYCGRTDDQYVDRTPVLRQGMRHKAVIAGIKHCGMQEAVDEHPPDALSSSYFTGTPPCGISTTTLKSCGGARPIGILAMCIARRPPLGG